MDHGCEVYIRVVAAHCDSPELLEHAKEFIGQVTPFIDLCSALFQLLDSRVGIEGFYLNNPSKRTLAVIFFTRDVVARRQHQDELHQIANQRYDLRI